MRSMRSKKPVHYQTLLFRQTKCIKFRCQIIYFLMYTLVFIIFLNNTV